MQLLIDDVRDLASANVIARDFDAGYAMLALGGWDEIVFDHDLGDDSHTGYDLLTEALENDWISDNVAVYLITSNPSGFSRMQQALEHHGFKAAHVGSNKFTKTD